MKHSYALVAIIAVATSACNRTGATGTNELSRIAELEAEVARLKAEQGRKPSQDELTRERAATALNAEVVTETYPKLTFRPDGLQLATKDGFVRFRTQNDFGSVYEFTPKGMETFGSLIKKSQVFFDLFEFITPASQGNEPSIALQQPLRQHVGEITGITSRFPGIAQVEFTIAYDFTPQLQPIRQYFYDSHRDRRTFQKYDDGWRVQPKPKPQ